jgi:hypothetical protein
MQHQGRIEARASARRAVSRFDNIALNERHNAAAASTTLDATCPCTGMTLSNKSPCSPNKSLSRIQGHRHADPACEKGLVQPRNAALSPFVLERSFNGPLSESKDKEWKECTATAENAGRIGAELTQTRTRAERFVASRDPD